MTTSSAINAHSPANSRIEKIQRYFDRDATYLRKDFNIRMRAEIVKSLIGPICESKILDLGCGDGSISRQFRNNRNRVVMIDVSADMLDLASGASEESGSSECEYIQANLLKQTLLERFDLILCLGVLAHVPAIDDAFRSICLHLRGTGRCVIQWADNERVTGKVMAMYGAVREKINGIYGYKLNPLRISDVVRTARKHGLFPLSLTRYHLILPGMGKLPNDALYQFQRMTLSHRALRALSTDVIGLFSVDPGSSEKAQVH
jgi:ubiquinone/menaquinone biosynthesis C-methylase UbiE